MKTYIKQIYSKYERELQILNNEKFLLFTLPIAFIFLLFFKFIKRIFHIRFGLIHSDRIGHFTANTELFLLEEYHFDRSKKYFDIYYFPQRPCNSFLALLWKKRLRILPKFLIRPFCLITRSLVFFKEFNCGKSTGGDMDIFNLYDKYDSILKFEAKDYIKASKFFAKLNI